MKSSLLGVKYVPEVLSEMAQREQDETAALEYWLLTIIKYLSVQVLLISPAQASQ